MMVAALYVQEKGSYFGLPSVDPWCEMRDARLYAGPYPVVAHPPCQRWGKMWFGQPLTVKRTGQRKQLGDDGGCFKAALSAVRQWGGVLEHPAGSHAWAYFGLARPPRSGGWVRADNLGAWTCCVEQGRYGHYARKPTWLIACHTDLPELDWGESEPRYDPAVIDRMGLKRAKRLGEVGARGGGKDSAPRIGTPAPFRDLLISIARTSSTLSSKCSSLDGPSHPDCPCKPGRCIYPNCTCALFASGKLQMTDTQTRIDQDYAQSRVAAYTYLKNRIDRIGNDILCDMRTGEDDSVTGFNKALDMVRDLLLEEIGRAAVTAMRDPVGGEKL